MFLHNDDRIDALVSVVGVALLIFGLIEADLRRRLPPDNLLRERLIENSAGARPTTHATALRTECPHKPHCPQMHKTS